MSRFTGPFLLLLFVGIALRCVALTQPLLDSGLLRQVQTAASTESILKDPGYPLSAGIPWLGDIDARFLLELPAYNYVTIGVYYLLGNLDLSGKITSILFWIGSFLLLQLIWSRILQPGETFWANFLFVLSPLGVFYSQAFMPEMLVQVLAFAFVLASIRYTEEPTIGRWGLTAATGLLGLLVKLPEISHLYFILAALLYRKEGWRGMFRPRYLIAAGITAITVKLWGNYADSINAEYLPEWTSKHILPGFIGTLASRFTVKPWAMVFLYTAFLIAAGPALLAMASGLRITLRRRRFDLLVFWLISIAIFYLVWFGNGGTAQSYYNLPALAPWCALFGIGVHAFLSWEYFNCRRKVVAILVGITVVLSTLPALLYLFKQDRQILAAATWVREHTNPDDVVLFRMRHRWDMVDYYYNPIPSYYSSRRAFIWTDLTPESVGHAALERSRYAVVTLPPSPKQGLPGAIDRFRGVSELKPDSLVWLSSAGFTLFSKGNGFVVYKRQ